MGLFSFKKNTVLEHIADAHDAAYNCFNTYDDLYDITCLKVAAWFIKAGVIDLADKYGISVTEPIPIQISGRMVKSTVGFAVSSSLRTLSIYLKHLENNERDYLQDIIDGGKALFEVEKEIPLSILKKYERI